MSAAHVVVTAPSGVVWRQSWSGWPQMQRGAGGAASLMGTSIAHGPPPRARGRAHALLERMELQGHVRLQVAGPGRPSLANWAGRGQSPARKRLTRRRDRAVTFYHQTQ